MDKYNVEHPRAINIEPTQRCNLRCKMCGRVNVDPANYKHTDMSIEVFEKILPLMKDAESISLTGFGEPLLNKDLAEMVRLAKQNSVKAEVMFTTNAALLTAKKAEELIDAGLDKFQVSIDGTTKWGHVGGGASVEKVINNLKRLNEIKARKNTDKPAVIFAFCAMKDNIHEIPDILDIAHDLGVKFITVQPLRPGTEEMRDQNIFRHLEYAKKVIDQSVEKAKGLGIVLQAQFMDLKLSEERRECTFPSWFFHVSFDGSVYMCCGGMPSGCNVKDQAVVEIWNSDPYRDLRKRMDTQDFPARCKTCSIMYNTIKNQEKDIPVLQGLRPAAGDKKRLRPPRFRHTRDKEAGWEKGPLKILHVVHGFPPADRAGAETYTYHLCKGLAKAHEVFVFARVLDRLRPEYEVTDEVYEGINVRRIVNNFTHVDRFERYYLNDDIEAAFEEYMDEVRPDVVHVQHLVGLSSSLVHAIKRRGVPMVMTLHDYWFMCPRVQLVDSLDGVCEGPREGHRCAYVCSDRFWTPPPVVVKTPLWRFLKRVTPQPVQRFIKYDILGAPKRKPQEEDEAGQGPKPLWCFLKRVTPQPVQRFIKYDILGAPKRKPQDADEAGQAAEKRPVRERAPIHEDTFNVELIKYFFRVAYHRNMLHNVDLLITPSRFVRDKFLEFGVDAARIRAIYHGINKEYVKKEPKTPSARLRFGYLGTLLKHKGLDVLIDAFNRLPGDRAELYIHGFGDEDEKGMLGRLKKKAKDGRVHFMGPYNHTELSGILSNLDVVVVPSIWHETFNIVAREALLSGCPVIASDIGALPEAIDDGRNGFLFEPGDPDDLSGKMMRFLDEPGLLERMRGEVTEIKGLEEHVSEIEEIYRGLFAGKPGRP